MRENINKPVFILDNELYILNSVFEHDNNFKGACGGILVPITQDYIDEMNDLDCIIDMYDYLWQDAVARGDTTDSQSDFFQSWIDGCDGLFIGHDDSDCYHAGVDELLPKFKDAVAFECVGGGRCFHLDKLLNNKNIEILDQKLFDLIIKYETETKLNLVE